MIYISLYCVDGIFEDSMLSTNYGIDIDSTYGSMVGWNIPGEEHRGISIKQLKFIYAEIEDRCEKEKWISKDRIPLAPDKVCLYDVNKHIIKERTRNKEYSYVELIATGEQTPTWFVSHWWGEPVIAMIRCLEQHCRDHKLSEETTYYWICVSVCMPTIYLYCVSS